jgi:solute carrier family 1 (glial high affinity glutamate transporter), member 2
MSQVGWFVVTFTIGVVFYQFVVMQLIYYVIVRKNPFTIYVNLIQAMLTASATCST